MECTSWLYVLLIIIMLQHWHLQSKRYTDIYIYYIQMEIIPMG